MFDQSELILIVVCLLVSLFNASVGTTGGVTFAAMATVLPPTAVVPIHGLVEGTSSFVRWLMLREFVDLKFVFAFVAGSVIGFALGWPLIGVFSAGALQLVLGLFILTIAFAPVGRLRLPAALTGAVTSCLTMIVGATGPLVAAILTHHLSDQRRLIATQALATAYQHTFKACLFGIWGFSFTPYLKLIAVLILAIVIGTWVGKRLLLQVPQQILRRLLKVTVTILGLRLVYMGITALV